MTVYERLLLPENLNYAWNKTKRLCSMFDGYTNHLELADFEVNLEQRIKDIQQRFKQGRWRTRALRPLPRPKKIQNNTAVDRQYYHVALEDQVAWVAVVNAIGPQLDMRMPSWSYGNRLYRPAWYEEDEDSQSRLEMGPYRHASGHVYRKFKHSWPLFRRHVALTARAMTRALPESDDDLDEVDQLALISARKDKLPYLRKQFWAAMPGTDKPSTLFRASVDLKQFYPRIRLGAVMDGLMSTDNIGGDMQNLLKGMLKFRLDMSETSPELVVNSEPTYDKRRVDGIPTGLFVAGFLANVAMLRVDDNINRQIMERRSIAHFRFVDDHTILSYNFDQLCEWLVSYRTMLDEYSIGVDINPEKSDPASLAQWIEKRPNALIADSQKRHSPDRTKDESYERAKRDCRIDGRNPTELLTKTLDQVSAIATTDVHTLDDDDLAERLKLLEWLLLANIPEREIRGDTRASFAAGRIASLAPMLVREVAGLVEESRNLSRLQTRTANEDTPSRKDALDFESTSRRLKRLEDELSRTEKRQLRHCFELLLQAFREYPAKPSLFYRMHQYCRITGFHGLTKIKDWIEEIQRDGYDGWAEYYLGLSHQLLARAALLSCRTYLLQDSLRSERRAASEFLKDLANIDASTFRVKRQRESWFHVMSRTYLGVTLLAISQVLSKTLGLQSRGNRLANLGSQFSGLAFESAPSSWLDKTGYSPAVWAHLFESQLSIDNKPSGSWSRFVTLFTFSDITSIRSVRRYPELLPDDCWNMLLHSDHVVRRSDAGFIREAIYRDENRFTQARSSKKTAFICAVKSLANPSKRWITLAEWTRFVRDSLSTFDPRSSEWTALEIVRQIVSPVVERIENDKSSLDRLHQHNVLLPARWKTPYASNPEKSFDSWQEWQDFARRTLDSSVDIKIKSRRTSVVDYRYLASSQGGIPMGDWERNLLSVGRLLLGPVASQLRRSTNLEHSRQ